MKMVRSPIISPRSELLPVSYLILLVVPAVIQGYTCNHRVPKAHEVVHDVHIEPAHIVKKRSINQPLRIHLHYDKSVSQLSSQKYKDLLQKTLVPQVVQYWQDTLMVRATRAPIRLHRKCSTQKVKYHKQLLYCVGGCAAETICGDITIPKEHLERCYCWGCDGKSKFVKKDERGPGVNNTDFILYVAALSSERCHHGNTVAYAAFCQQEKALDRPVAGYFSICPNSLSTGPQQRKQLFSTLKHEILHALGFTAGLYAFYRDSKGEPLTQRNKFNNKPNYDFTLHLYKPSKRVIRQVNRPDWLLKTGNTTRPTWMVVTPRVVEEVRKHFNCSTLEGAELEDQLMDGKTLADNMTDGTAFTHWEKRVFENEAMTGTYTQNPVISRVTLALLEDTGWYSVKYENADLYEWGKNLGCDFVKKSCYDWIVTRKLRNESIHPFCDQVKWGQLKTDCTNNRHSVAVCNLVEHKTLLPPEYQYFTELAGVSAEDTNQFGGSVDLADYCPYLQELLWKSGKSLIRGSRCTQPQNNLEPAHNYFLENYGRNSRCFTHEGIWHLQHCNNLITTQHMGSGCYQYNCSREVGLTVIVAGKLYRCYHKGQQISILHDSAKFRHQGMIICPACNEICKEDNVVCPPDTQSPEIQNKRKMPPHPCQGTTPSLSGFMITLVTAATVIIS